MEVKTNFKLGDTVWALENGKAVNFVIKSISCCISVTEGLGYTYYNSDESGIATGYSVSAKKAFRSKEELINAIFGETDND